jgi:hypothetical protein
VHEVAFDLSRLSPAARHASLHLSILSIYARDTSLAGSLFEAAVYAWVLLQGAGLLSEGSELLLEILNPGLIGGGPFPTC